MGLENRDYVRDGSYTASLTGFGVDFTPVVKYLIIANVVVFLLQIFIVRKVGPEEMLRSFAERAQRYAKGAEKAGSTARDEAKKQEEFEEFARKQRRDMERIATAMVQGTRVSVVQEWLELDPEKTIHEFQLWRLVTCAFCHHRYHVWHIIVNMFLLFWFGTRLESMYGSREFLLFYLAAAVAGSLAYVGLAFYSDSNVPAIGASGAVMGVMMLYTIFYPFETFLFFWVIPVPLWILMALYVIYDLHPVLLALSGDQLRTGVAHAGHLGGLAFAVVYWKLGLRLEAPFARGERPRRLIRRRPPIPDDEPAVLAHPQRDTFNEQLDEVLRKISEQGKESLTEAEREILLRASIKYRERR